MLRGSNHLGRLNHGRVGGQTGADADRVSDILKVLPVDDAVLDPGDTLFFHSNLLHKSNRNDSAHRRWAFLIAYNRASNNPTIEHHHPRYTPLEKVILLLLKSIRFLLIIMSKSNVLMLPLFW